MVVYCRWLIAVMLLGAIGTAQALDWQTLWQRPDQQAYKQLQNGDATSAAALFDDPQWRGVSHYRAGEFDQAQEQFSSTESEAGRYNQALTAVQQGDYKEAIEQFESLLAQSPDHNDAKHNLEIARELAKLEEQQQQSDQQQSSDEQQQQDKSDSEDSSSDNESESGSGEPQSDEAQSGGDLTTDAEEAAQQQAESESQQQESEQDAQQANEQASASGEQADDSDEADESDKTIPVSAAPTESEQATEQWLRRIQDDPSQLLRNKIKLNHMIEHADVRDMQEPW